MRALIEGSCREHARYRFVVASAGRVCCAADDPARMCAECRAVAAAPQRREPDRSAATTRFAVEQEHQGVPPPPDLGALIRAARGMGAEKAPEIHANAQVVPDPPDLGALIRAARARR